MPTDLRLTAVPATGEAPLASHVAASRGEDIVLPVPGADQAGLDGCLGVPVGDLLAACEAGQQPGDLSQVVASVDGQARRVFFLGTGDGSPAHMRKAGEALGRRVTAGRPVLTTAVYGRPAESARAFAEGLLLGAYTFTLATRAPAAGAAEVRLLVQEAGGLPGLAEATTFARATALARDLANTPSVSKTPVWLAEQAVRAAGESGVSARVWEPGELAAHGFGGVLAVGAGSAQPPRLIELGYQPQTWDKHVVLVGKGITFDSGGLSLKPNEGMMHMKTDMAGGAVVIAVMSALAALGVGVRVTGLVPAAENMPSGHAQRPGDVITHYGGITTEVLNTDAEGRLVLADAIAYADAVLSPDVIVDIATLTGAARVALGATHAALYASTDDLARALLDAGAAAGEPLWRMPLVDEYAEALESPVADLANVSHGEGPTAGSIIAALFLRRFTGGRPWAHLDIAGAARAVAKPGDQTAMATGYGTRLLLHWLASA